MGIMAALLIGAVLLVGVFIWFVWDQRKAARSRGEDV